MIIQSPVVHIMQPPMPPSLRLVVRLTCISRRERDTSDSNSRNRRLNMRQPACEKATLFRCFLRRFFFGSLDKYSFFIRMDINIFERIAFRFSLQSRLGCVRVGAREGLGRIDMSSCVCSFLIISIWKFRRRNQNHTLISGAFGSGGVRVGLCVGDTRRQ